VEARHLASELIVLVACSSRVLDRSPCQLGKKYRIVNRVAKALGLLPDNAAEALCEVTASAAPYEWLRVRIIKFDRRVISCRQPESSAI
jgi:hypothetical protein